MTQSKNEVTVNVADIDAKIEEQKEAKKAAARKVRQLSRLKEQVESGALAEFSS